MIYLCHICFVRDCQQITFAMLTRFYLLSKNPKMNRIPSKIKWKIHALFTLYFKFWRYFLYSHHIFYFLLFLLAFTSVDIFRTSQIFRTSFNIIWKKRFLLQMSFFNRFTQAPHPLNDRNLLSVTKKFFWWWYPLLSQSKHFLLHIQIAASNIIHFFPLEQMQLYYLVNLVNF